MKMLFIGYDELNPGKNFPKLKDSVEAKEYPNKKTIVKFLKNGTVELARHSRTKDVFSGEIIPDEALLMHDGDFYWSSVLAWYVDKYNLRLPKNFETHILKNA